MYQEHVWVDNAGVNRYYQVRKLYYIHIDEHRWKLIEKSVRLSVLYSTIRVYPYKTASPIVRGSKFPIAPLSPPAIEMLHNKI